MSGHVQEDYPLMGSYGSENGRKWFWVGLIAFVCWNILLFSLAVAAIAKVNNIKEPEVQPVILSQSVSVTASNAIPHMNVVSLLPDGTIRSGAGTTVFSKTTPPPPFGVGSQNVRVARFVDEGSVDQVIVVWTNNTGSYAVLGTLSLDKQSVTGWFVPVQLPFTTFYDLITLASNHFLIATDKAVWAGTANTKAGAMNISTLVSANYPQAPVWRDIRLTALGGNNFVVSYDTGFISTANSTTTFGAVVGSVMWDMANKLPNVTFLTNVTTWQGGFPVHDVFALSESTFVLAYSSAPNGNNVPELACVLGRFGSNPPSLTLGTPTVYAGVEPEFHLSVVGLDATTGIVVFVDQGDEYALRAVLVHRSSNVIDGVHFGDITTVESGVADSIFTRQFENGILPFIDSARISANKVAVAWADYSNNARLTTAILTVDQASNIHTSPLYVIGEPLTLEQLTNYSISVAGLSIEPSHQFGAVIIDRKVATDAAGSGNVALIESGNKAFGVADHDAFAGQSASVVVSGLVTLPSSFPTDLKPGYLYYGRTDGSLQAGPLAGSIDMSTQYVTLSDGSIVSTDSVVGLAVNKRQLYVLPSH